MRHTGHHRAVLAAALVLAAASLAGCFNEDDQNTNEGTDASPGEVVVEVLLTDGAIEMPAQIPAGSAVFEVSNGGSSDHGFVIEGIEGGLESLRVDQLDTLRADLEPGTYIVYSPVEGDREAGLEHELTVTAGGGESGAPLTDEGVGPGEEQAPIEGD